VIEIEPVDVPEISEAEGDAEADSQSPDSQSPDSQSPDSQSPELGAVPELEMFEPLPAGDFVLTFVADDPELRRTLLTRLAAGDGADSFEKALAAGTMERLRTAAERGEAYRTVRLHRVSLASDQVMPIESAVDGAEVLLAVDAPGAPRIVGSGNPGQAVWKGVRVFAAPSSRPLLLWDRLAGQDRSLTDRAAAGGPVMPGNRTIAVGLGGAVDVAKFGNAEAVGRQVVLERLGLVHVRLKERHV
jgi:hypothetical protein